MRKRFLIGLADLMVLVGFCLLVIGAHILWGLGVSCIIGGALLSSMGVALAGFVKRG